LAPEGNVREISTETGPETSGDKVVEFALKPKDDE